MNEEFQGELSHIEPYRLIKKDKNDEVANFFLVLAVVFNDLKGIDIFERLIISRYRKPPFTEKTAHSGEFSGILTQTRKIFISNLREFFDFLKENKNVLSSFEFKDILNKTSKDTQNRWKNIVDIALNNESQNIKDFTEYLVEVRNNVAYHYYQPKGLRKAFINFFYNKDKIEQNDLAYYSLGEDIRTTRFYFADASVQEYLRSANQENSKEFNYKYQNEIGTILNDVSITIFKILKVYLKNRPK